MFENFGIAERVVSLKCGLVKWIRKIRLKSGHVKSILMDKIARLTGRPVGEPLEKGIGELMQPLKVPTH